MAAFSFTNSRGITYYLYTKKGIQLRGAKEPRDIFFFSKEADRNLGEGEEAVTAIPSGYKVEESTRNGFVYLKKA